MEMMDAYLAERERLQFEQAFHALEVSSAPQRPKANPWHHGLLGISILKKAAPPTDPEVRNPGIAYRTGLS